MLALTPSNIPHPAALPMTGLIGLGTSRRPNVTLLKRGPPLQTLAMRHRHEQVPDESAGKLIQMSLDSLRALQTTGERRHFLMLQGMVMAMLEIQRQGAIRIDPHVVMKAWDTMSTIQARHYDVLAGAWAEPIRMTAPEMANLESAIHHHGAQMLHSSKGELIDAIKRSQAWSQQQADAIVAKVRRMN